MSMLQSAGVFLMSPALTAVTPWIILLTAVIYIFLHGRRHNKIIAYLSIITGFIPILIHEIGHAVMATVTRGSVGNIYMVLTPDRQMREGRQGFAETGSRNWLSSVLITFAGYSFPPLFFIAGVFLAVHGYSIIFIGILILMFLYYLWHTSQKWLPILIIILLIIGSFSIITSSSGFTADSINTFYSIILGLLLGEMIQSIIITAKINFKGGIEWDGTAMRQLTYIPATIWWFVWAVISIWSMYQSFQLVTHALNL